MNKHKKEIFKKVRVQIKKDLDGCMGIINDYAEPLKIPTDPDEKHEYFKERLTGRLSTDSLLRAGEQMRCLENMLGELANMEYQFERSNTDLFLEKKNKKEGR